MAGKNIQYKGFDINVTRDKCLGGWEQTYFSVYRISDGLEVICDFSQSDESINEYIKYMKKRIDEFIATKGESEELEEEY